MSFASSGFKRANQLVRHISFGSLLLSLIGLTFSMPLQAQHAPTDLKKTVPAKDRLIPDLAELKVAIQQLGAPDFRTRARASKTLWAGGIKSYPLLAEQLEAEDPEIRMRAKEIHDKLGQGRWPHLPRELKLLVKEVHNSPTIVEKATALEDLLLADDPGVQLAGMITDNCITNPLERTYVLEALTDSIRRTAWPLMKAGNVEEGRALFQKSFTFAHPRIKEDKNPETWNGFAWDCALARHHFKEAHAAIDRAIAADNDDYTFLDTKAELLFVQGDRKGAIEFIDKALKLNPDFNATYYTDQKKRFETGDLDSHPDY